MHSASKIAVPTYYRNNQCLTIQSLLPVINALSWHLPPYMPCSSPPHSRNPALSSPAHHPSTHPSALSPGPYRQFPPSHVSFVFLHCPLILHLLSSVKAGLCSGRDLHSKGLHVCDTWVFVCLRRARAAVDMPGRRREDESEMLGLCSMEM